MTDNVLIIHHKKGVHPDELGLIPTFVNPRDPRPVREQIDGNYQHGGGWRPIQGYAMSFEEGINGQLQYPGEEPLEPIALIRVRDEMVILYRYGITAILQKDKSFEVARLD